MVKYKALLGEKFDKSKITVVGSPTITSDGVASGFSSSNYVQIPSINLSNNFKISIKNLRSVSSEKNTTLMVLRGTSGYINLFKNTTGMAYQFYDGSHYSDYLRLNDTSKPFDLEFISDGANFTANLIIEDTVISTVSKEISFFSNYVASSNATINLGYGSGLGYAFLSSINLTAFKIYVDGQLVFQPVKPTYLLERRKPKVWNKGQFTIVGSPGISESGIASGFSTTSYIEIPNTNLQNADTWEVEGVVQAFSQGVDDDKAWLSPTSGNGLMLPVACKTSNTNIEYQLYLSSTNTSWDIATDSSIKFPSGSRVKCNLKFTGTQYIYTCTNLNTGEVKQVVKNSTLKIYQSPTQLGCKRKTGPLKTNDNIDLKQFKIYTDNTLVFDGGAETYVYDPSKFTIVGSPTITEYGVASGFVTNSSYIETDCMLNPTGDWKYEIEFTTSNDVTSSQTITSGRTISSSPYGLLITVLNGRLLCYIGTSSKHIIDTSTFTTVQPNTKYKWMGEYKNGTYYLSLNGNVYKTLTSTEKLVSNKGQYYGDDVRFPNAFLGSINLPSTSITVDGKEVFTGAKENYYMLSV